MAQPLAYGAYNHAGDSMAFLIVGCTRAINISATEKIASE